MRRVRHRIILSSSNSVGGVTRRDLTTSTFDQTISQTTIPLECDPFIAMPNAQIWNHFVTISTAKTNNKLYYTDDVGTPNKYSITIPDGYWSVVELNAQINAGVLANSHTTGLIQIGASDATQKIVWYIQSAGWQIYFPAGTFYLITGNTLNQKIPAGGLTTAEYTEYSPNVANFSACTAIHVHASPARGSSLYGGSTNDIVGIVVPDVSPGSLINYEPQNLVFYDAPLLRNTTITSINVRLTTELGVALASSQDFALEIIIGW